MTTKWSNKKPSETGWYFYRWSEHQHKLTCRIYRMKGVLRIAFFHRNGCDRHVLSSLGDVFEFSEKIG